MSEQPPNDTINQQQAHGWSDSVYYGPDQFGTYQHPVAANSPKRLYRSRVNRKIGGVAGGLAEYIDVDPTLIRLAFVALALLPGPAWIGYIAAWIIIPEAPQAYPQPNAMTGQAPYGMTGQAPYGTVNPGQQPPTEPDSTTPQDQTEVPESGHDGGDQ